MLFPAGINKKAIHPGINNRRFKYKYLNITLRAMNLYNVYLFCRSSTIKGNKHKPINITNGEFILSQVDAGLINYGYGHFGEDPDSPQAATSSAPGSSTRVSGWPPPMKPLSPSKSMMDSFTEPSQKPLQSSLGSIGITKVVPVEDAGDGPAVNIVPASLPNSPSLASPPGVESTQSQENLELLLSPKTLE
ncbi:hypothetical protein SK128_027837 [Halocaridina rubra]|uniref:Uncharacterized protein n=1 Tax=Halocaridina rubra TaxID=373956 RepID=A0AAN8ZWE6_HALRR